MISTLTPVFSHRDSPRDSTEDTGQRLFHVKVTLSRWAQPDGRGKGGLKRWRRSNGRDHREDPKNTSRGFSYSCRAAEQPADLCPSPGQTILSGPGKRQCGRAGAHVALFQGQCTEQVALIASFLIGHSWGQKCFWKILPISERHHGTRATPPVRSGQRPATKH